MHVGGDPDGVAHPGLSNERQEIGNFQLPSARWAIGMCDCVVADEPDRQVGGDDLPDRGRARELTLEPSKLLRAKDAGVWSVAFLVPEVWSPVAAHIQDKQV